VGQLLQFLFPSFESGSRVNRLQFLFPSFESGAGLPDFFDAAGLQDSCFEGPLLYSADLLTEGPLLCSTPTGRPGYCLIVASRMADSVFAVGLLTDSSFAIGLLTDSFFVADLQFVSSFVARFFVVGLLIAYSFVAGLLIACSFVAGLLIACSFVAGLLNSTQFGLPLWLMFCFLDSRCSPNGLFLFLNSSECSSALLSKTTQRYDRKELL
ncbi:hypothetical protein AMECASPLE_004012, partial [Ameca splendens]